MRNDGGDNNVRQPDSGEKGAGENSTFLIPNYRDAHNGGKYQHEAVKDFYIEKKNL